MHPNPRRQAVAAFLLLGPLLGTVSAEALATDSDVLNRAVAERHIVPGYAALAAATAALDDAATRHCVADGPTHKALHAAYRDAFLAWQDVQHVRIGPIVAFGRDFRFQLWPDKRGSVGKHLAQLMAERDPAALEPERFAAGSVAVQGFGALERLLYGPPPAEAERDWHCRVVSAITGNLARMAAETVAAWRDGPSAHRLMFATASRGNAHYASADELSARLLNDLHTQLERLVEHKLSRPLGDNVARAMPKRAEAWRSGLSLAAVERNLAALDALYRTGFAPRRDDQALLAAIGADLAAARQLAGSLAASTAGPLSQQVGDPDARADLERLRDHLASLRARIAGELATALDLPLAFNSLDGD